MLFEILILAALAHTPCIDKCLEIKSKNVVRIYDGDTITIKVESWPETFRIMSVRLRGFDTPEIRGDCYQEQRLARKAKKELIRVVKNGEVVRLDDLEGGKYFRVIATVSVDSIDIKTHMIDKGLAREYLGGRRESWCEENRSIGEGEI